MCVQRARKFVGCHCSKDETSGSDRDYGPRMQSSKRPALPQAEVSESSQPAGIWTRLPGMLDKGEARVKSLRRKYCTVLAALRQTMRLRVVKTTRSRPTKHAAHRPPRYITQFRPQLSHCSHRYTSAPRTSAESLLSRRLNIISTTLGCLCLYTLLTIRIPSSCD